jgi:hypothetical protein
VPALTTPVAVQLENCGPLYSLSVSYNILLTWIKNGSIIFFPPILSDIPIYRANEGAHCWPVLRITAVLITIGPSDFPVFMFCLAVSEDLTVAEDLPAASE